MVQIREITENQEEQILNLHIEDPELDFSGAKKIAKDKALEICDFPMILSWKNAKTGESYPDYECGITDRPFWIRYAEGRGANLTIDINEGDYIFMILKM